MTVERPVDQDDRERAIHERTRNVIVDAGAGTGKTTLLVSRLLHLIAPGDDGEALRLERIAAITFTRKAAGELKLRLRERLLAELGSSELTALRQQRLTAAIEVLDNAMICTVHSFADRLLRLRPIDARLSPAYEIAEDPSALIDEVFANLLTIASEEGAIDGLDLSQDPAWKEAIDTIRMFQSAGLLTWSVQTEHRDQLGLDAFISDVIQTRDRALQVPSSSPMNLEAVRRDIDELGRLVQDLEARTTGTASLRRLYDQALRMVQSTDESEALRRAVRWSTELGKLKGLLKGAHFEDDANGWDVRRWLCEGKRGKGKAAEERPDGPLGKAIVRPMFECMANRLVRMREVVLQEYKRVKRKHGVVDGIELLIQLRDLIQQDLAARSFYQARLDHVMVDEFQDTDPLQAEIVLLLCEANAVAARAFDVKLKPGKLTIVGDPKQSIYRFRRADIAMYALVCDKLRERDACEVQLRVNFRSSSKIIDWLNAGFDEILGRQADGPLLDAVEGTVRNVHLVARGSGRSDAEVHVLPFGGDEELNAEGSRDLEGEVLAHYLRHLVEDSELQIFDPRSHQLRRPRYGDIAIVMISTLTVHHLTSELDRLAVPHVVRGGTLFMEDPLHQQFILGLRALADRCDGVAMAALQRPPFFAVSLEDLARAAVSDSRSAALEATQNHIQRLRRERHVGAAGEVARRVLETTGFGPYVAAGVNGAQRLARLYELCLAFGELAREYDLDFDGATALARTWLDMPPRHEVPLPVDADAVQVITAHQAKGLEWPIVALWDGRALWGTQLSRAALAIDSANGEWAIDLHEFKHDPSDRALHEREKVLRAAERQRVAYVAATRARDVFIVPEAGGADAKTIAGTLILNGQTQPHRRAAAYKQGDTSSAWWTSERRVSMRPLLAARANLHEAWREAAAKAHAPYLRPAAVSVIAHAVREDVREADERELTPVPGKVGRFGPLFGTAVHRALELILRRGLSPQLAAAQAVREGAVDKLLPSVLEDVGRACRSLESAGLLQHAMELEYPVAGSVDNATLVSGFIDLLVAAPDGLCIIDFKTDAAPRGDVQREYPGYVEQVHAYAKVLSASGEHGLRVTRTGLLFTADGGMHWV